MLKISEDARREIEEAVAEHNRQHPNRADQFTIVGYSNICFGSMKTKLMGPSTPAIDDLVARLNDIQSNDVKKQRSKMVADKLKSTVR